jgi:hypothetical protein
MVNLLKAFLKGKLDLTTDLTNQVEEINKTESFTEITNILDVQILEVEQQIIANWNERQILSDKLVSLKNSRKITIMEGKQNGTI